MEKSWKRKSISAGQSRTRLRRVASSIRKGSEASRRILLRSSESGPVRLSREAVHIRCGYRLLAQIRHRLMPAVPRLLKLSGHAAAFLLFVTGGGAMGF